MAKQICPKCRRYTTRKKGWLSSELKCDHCGAVISQKKKAIKQGVIRRRTIGYDVQTVVKGGTGWRKNWNDVRKKALKKAKYKCKRCGSQFSLEVHHNKPVSEGGKDKLSNLTVLCQHCHDQVHAEMKTKKRKGCFLIPFGILLVILGIVVY